MRASPAVATGSKCPLMKKKDAVLLRLSVWDIEKNLDFGAWAAAMVSRKLGGRVGIPTLEQIGQAGY